MPYLLNNCTSKTLDYFIPSMVFNRIKPKKQLSALNLLNLRRNLINARKDPNETEKIKYQKICPL